MTQQSEEPATIPTRRQAEFEAIAAEEARLRQNFEQLDRRAQEIEQQIAAMEEERATTQARLEEMLAHEARSGETDPAARKLRAQRDRLDDDIPHQRELRQEILNLVHGEAFQAHSVAHQQLARAQIALRREPCELLLLELDALFRQIEEAWARAGQEALAQARQGDAWGETTLRRFQFHLNSSLATTPEGPFTIRMPRLEKP